MFVNILKIDIQYHIIRLFYHTRKEHCYYFLIPTSNENNLIYLFITQTAEREIKTQFAQFSILARLFIYKLTGLLDITGL